MIYSDGETIDLSEASPIVGTLSDHLHGNDRLYVPRELLRRTPPAQSDLPIFEEIYHKFRETIKNGKIISLPEK